MLNLARTRAILSRCREADRFPVDAVFKAQIAASEAFEVEVADVSASGLRLNCDRRLDPGSILRIALAFGRAPYVRIIWTEGRSYGCEFTRPLPTADLAELIACGRRSASGDAEPLEHIG